MKTQISIARTTSCPTLLLPLLLLLALPAVVQAQFNYETNNGTITITGYTGPGGAVTIPSTINGLPVTSVGWSAFAHWFSLTSVTIPDTVTMIEDEAFYECFNLTSVTIPNSVTSIGEGAFTYCTSLRIVTIPNGVTNLVNTFWGCSNLTNVTIGTSVNSLVGTFGGCTRLTTVTIPASVTNIGEEAFYNCGGLTSVTIPSSVTKIGEKAFYDCDILSALYFWGDSPSLGGGILTPHYNNPTNSSLYYYSTTIYYWPETRGWEAWYGGYPIAPWDPVDQVTYASTNGAVTITGCAGPGGALVVPEAISGQPVTSIGDYAFHECFSLTSITIPNSVTNIGEEAFDNSGLTNVTIPDSVISIGEEAFFRCFNLTSVTLGDSVTSIGYRAFSDCASLSAITVDALNSVYSSLDGVLFNKGQTLLIQCPGGKAGSYTIPGRVTSIGDCAFWNCFSLASVTIPENLTSVRDSMFVNCTSLTSVMIPDSVISIGDLAFEYCQSLTNITIPNSVTSIGNAAFSDCTSLTGVYFQGNAPSVDSSVFNGDNNATVHYLPGTRGWGTTFDGRPTALWVLPNPLILTTAARFGVSTNGFGFTMSWATNVPVVVEATTNLTTPSWVPLATNTLVNGWSHFSDPDWTNYPGRFYRLGDP